MISILYFIFLVLPFASIFVLAQFFDIAIGEVVVDLGISVWLKFFIFFVIFIIFYFVMRTLINRANGGIKRKVFYTISFGFIGLFGVAFALLFILGVLSSYEFDNWTIAFMAYFALVDLFALTTTLIRTFTDDKYHCSHCDRFGVTLMDFSYYDIQSHSYEKPMIDVHSQQVYDGTEVRTHTEWQECDGKMVDGSLKTTTTLEDKYRTDYYTTMRMSKRKYYTKDGAVRCKKCGQQSRYYSVDPL